jgi:O-antigen ligase/Tfp pilus assembly protein PilF
MTDDSSFPRSRPPASAWALAALVVASVAVFDPAGWAAFGPVKWAAVTTLTLLAAALLAFQGPFPIHRGSAFAWAAFLAWGVAVSLAALDPLSSWIGTPDRRLGLVAWVLFAVAFFAGQAAGDAGGVRLLLRAAALALVFIGGYSLMELAGAAPVDVTFEASRLGGPFGSPAYLGAACALLIPIGAGAALDGTETRAWRIVAAVGVAGGVAAAAGSQTRAAWVGLAVAAALTVPRWWRWLRRTWWVGLAAVVAVAVTLAVTPLGSRAASILDPGGATSRGRLAEWRVGAAVLAAHPVSGVGFEGYRIAFPTHVDAGYERRYGRAYLPDRVHNGPLDIGVTTGAPGFLLALAALVWLAGRAWRGVRDGAPWLVGVAAGVAGYLTQQQFLFPLAEIDPVFWVFAGVLVAATGGETGTVSVRPPRLAGWLGLGLAGAALVAGALDVGADHAIERAFSAAAAGDVATAREAADEATDLRPDSFRTWFTAASVAAAAGDFDLALDRIDRSLDRSPRDPRLLETRAGFLLDRARRSGVAADVAAAVAAWEDRVIADPFNAEDHLQLGLADVLAGDVAGAESAWLTAEDLAPSSPVPAANLAVLYLDTGRIDEAAAALARARTIAPDDPKLDEIQQRIDIASSPS